MSNIRFEIEATDDVTCVECHFFQPSPSGGHGYCKRFPPVFTNIDEHGRPRFYNPVVSPHSFCGEFEPMDIDDE